MILLSLTNVHYIYSRSIQIDTSRTTVIKALYKCDSLNTLLTDNLKKATLKDSLLQNELQYERKSNSEKEEEFKEKIKNFNKEKLIANFKVGGVVAVLAFVIGLVI